MEPCRALHNVDELVGLAHHVDYVGHDIAMLSRESLPFDGAHAMALKISESAVVTEHIEPVVDAFESSSWTVATVGSVADVGLHDAQTLSLIHI